jgi:AraC-like DNA-binding protein
MGMKYFEVKPPANLQHIVRFFWVIEHTDTNHQPVPFRLFAESCPGLVFFCRSGYAAISGITTQHTTASISGDFKMIGAYFYPYALPMIFGSPAKLFAHTQIRLSDINENEARRLSDQVLHSKNTDEQLAFVTTFITSKIKHAFIDPRVRAGVNLMMAMHGNCDVEQLADHANLSERQLERKFSDSVGVSPKLLARLIRFQHVLRTPVSDRTSLTDIALAAGYYDQSHFIRDFSEFSGLNPKAYFSLTSTQVADNFIQL